MPLDKPELEFVFGLKADLGDLIVIGESPEGLRRMIPILGGSVKGPRLNGEVLGGGADWQFVRSDEVTIAEATYLLRSEDGALVQVRNRGVRHGPGDVLRRVLEGDEVDPSEYYFRSTPTFLVAAGRYDWLNRAVFVATGARSARAIELQFYRVT
jgi:hypothetical protein